MKRESINPTDWGLQFAMDQGEVVTGAERHLRCSGQISVVSDPSQELGVRVVAPNDMRGQMECALANVDAVLEGAKMSRSDILSLRFYTTDVALSAPDSATSESRSPGTRSIEYPVPVVTIRSARPPRADLSRDTAVWRAPLGLAGASSGQSASTI